MTENDNMGNEWDSTIDRFEPCAIDGDMFRLVDGRLVGKVTGPVTSGRHGVVVF
jgi:hypothetical protein